MSLEEERKETEQDKKEEDMGMSAEEKPEKWRESKWYREERKS